jgi:hypothetical protein
MLIYISGHLHMLGEDYKKAKEYLKSGLLQNPDEEEYQIMN